MADTIEILDDIEEWPLDIVEDGSNMSVRFLPEFLIVFTPNAHFFRIVHAFETITESLIEQRNFADINVITEDVALSGKRVSINYSH